MIGNLLIKIKLIDNVQVFFKQIVFKLTLLNVLYVFNLFDISLHNIYKYYFLRFFFID